MKTRKTYTRAELTEYEVKRNALIPTAEVYANNLAGVEPAKDSKHYKAWVKKWNQTFHAKMNELAKGKL